MITLHYDNQVFNVPTDINDITLGMWVRLIKNFSGKERLEQGDVPTLLSILIGMSETQAKNLSISEVNRLLAHLTFAINLPTSLPLQGRFEFNGTTYQATTNMNSLTFDNYANLDWALNKLGAGYTVEDNYHTVVALLVREVVGNEVKPFTYGLDSRVATFKDLPYPIFYPILSFFLHFKTDLANNTVVYSKELKQTAIDLIAKTQASILAEIAYLKSTVGLAYFMNLLRIIILKKQLLKLRKLAKSLHS